MIKFYFHPSPNPLKIALYLEETGEPYDLIPVDTRKGEQHSDAFKAINPNAKTPWAKKPWEFDQENNLRYVMATRAKSTLTFITWE